MTIHWSRILLAPAIGMPLGLILRAMVFQSTVVGYHSMEPTLHVGDVALVDKRPYTLERLERKDIVVFRWDPLDEETTYVKRIVALPGETVALRNGRVWINGASLAEPYVREEPLDDCIVPVQVGPDEFFVMGDNRNHSEDSRDRGCVPKVNIVGKVIRVVWPVSRFLGDVNNPPAGACRLGGAIWCDRNIR